MSARILHVAAVDFTVAKLLAPQLDELAARGYEVRVACQRTDAALWAELERFSPTNIPFPRELSPLKMLRACALLSREVQTWKPDVLHLHTPAASLPIRALPHPSWSKNTATVYTVHGYLHRWPPVGAKEKVVQKVEQWEARRTRALLFQSAEDYEISRRLGYRSSLVLLGNGVEDGWFDISSRERGNIFNLFFVGRIVRGKGILELLDAVEGVPGVHLHIVGDALETDRDPVADEVAERLTRPGLALRVTRHGMVRRSVLQQLYAEADALCLPSYREGVPRSVIEALAAGRPVIATEIRGCRELVTNGDNGYLVPAGQVAPLKDAITRIAALDAGALTLMGQHARQSVDPERRESAVFNRIINVYASVGAEPPDSRAGARCDPFPSMRLTRQNDIQNSRMASELARRKGAAPENARFAAATKESVGSLMRKTARTPAQPARALRVLHVIVDLRVGGAERLVVDLVVASRARGTDARIVTLAMMESPVLDRARALGVPVEELAAHRADPRGWVRMLRRCTAADVVHAHLFPALWIVGLFVRGRLVGTEHSPHNRRRNNRVLAAIDRHAYKRYDALVAISDGVAESLNSHLGFPADRIRVIHNGIDLGRVEPRVVAVHQQPLKLISVGTLDSRKDVGRLLKAAGGLKGTMLTVVGDGPERTSLEGDAAVWGDHITFTGSREDVPALLSNSHVFVSTSRYEGFGLAAAEALAAGLPVLAPNLPGLREVVGDAGLLHEPGDTQALRDHIVRLRDDRDYLSQLSVAAAQQGRKFALTTTVERHEALYRELAQRG